MIDKQCQQLDQMDEKLKQLLEQIEVQQQKITKIGQSTEMILNQKEVLEQRMTNQKLLKECIKQKI